MEAGMLELETELLEQVALDEEMAESVWHEIIEASTEAAILLYLAPPEMPEEEPAEEDMGGIEEPPDREYKADGEKYGRSRLGEYPAEEEKTLYEKESEKRASEEEPNENNKEVEKYGK